MIIKSPFSKKLESLSSYLNEKIGGKYISIGVLFIAILSVFYFTQSITSILNDVKVEDVYYESAYSPCSGNEKILIKSKNLKRLLIPFRYNAAEDLEPLKHCVALSTDHFFEIKIAKNEIDEDSFLEILFTPPLSDFYEKELQISVSDVPIFFNVNNDGLLSNKQYGLPKLKVFIITFIFLIVFFVIFLFILKLNSLSLSLRYLFLNILLGTGLIIVIPPFGIPDEKVHFNTAYEFSNKILHTSSFEQDGYIQMRECDTQLLPNNDFSREDLYQDLTQIYDISQWKTYYAHAAKNITKSGNQSDFVKTQGMYISNMFLYIPETLGISLARVLKLNQFVLFYLGRFFSLLCSSLLFFFIFRISKTKNELFYFIPLLPMFIQQQMAYTYDTFINVCALGLCVFIYSYYESNDKKMLLASIPFAFLLWFPKGHIYSILYLLYICVIKDVFKIEIKKNVKKYIGFGFLGAIIIITILSNFIHLKTLNQKIGFALRNPMGYFIDLGNSFFYQAAVLIEQLLGIAMGVRNIYISSVISIGMVILLLITFLRYEPCNFISNKLNGISIIIVCLGIFLIYFAMYFGMPYNSVGNTILGVQGRYFLPFVGLLAFFSLSEKIKITGFEQVKFNPITILSIFDLLIVFDILFRLCINPISKWTF